MKKNLTLIFALTLLLGGCVQTHKEIKPYVNFLKKQNTTAKDYVLSLFENYDIVILCERDHRDITQYNLILDIMRDQYFIDNVGVVFTEIGEPELNPKLNNFLQNPHLTELEINEQLLYFQRNADFPLWEKSNFSYFIKGIYDINKEITEKKLKMYPTDIWHIEGQPTLEKVRDLWFTKVEHRDSLMADNFIERFDELKQKNPRQKALVIQNYRHAFRIHAYNADGEKIDNNVGKFLFDKYPNRVANVMINSAGNGEIGANNDITFTTIQNGKWDASFQKANKYNIGFNFKGSPFGNDSFDYWAFENNFTYTDMFTGFVFYQPIEKFEIAVGVSGLMDDGWLEKFYDRINLFFQVLERPLLDNKNDLMPYNDIRISNVEDLDGIKSQIQKWLK